MTAFLYRVAEKYYKEYKNEIRKVTFVFPNRRAGLFFQKYLSSLSKQPIFSPNILTISDLLTELSGLFPADKIRMLFLLYEIYMERSESEETFDEFVYWGDILLSDFDDVDKYLIDADKLFSNVTDLRAIDHDFDFLTPNQIAAIRSFWSSFNPEKGKSNETAFIAIWEILFDIYTEFRNRLLAEESGYGGMIFREVAERYDKGDWDDFPYEKVVFVGLNALTEAERLFLKALKKKGVAEFYWDYEDERVRDKDNKASLFVERNLTDFPNSSDWVNKESTDCEFKLIGVPSNVGQARQVYPIIEELIAQGELTTESAIRTAVVLPDEELLMPVLHAIPDGVEKVNVTMGYPLNNAPIAILIEHIIDLQRNIRYVDKLPRFYFKDVLAILRHPYIIASGEAVVNELSKEITSLNKIYISVEELNKTDLLVYVFKAIEQAEKLSDYLIYILKELHKLLTKPVDETDEDLDEDQPIRMEDMEREFIFQYYTAVNRINDMIASTTIQMSAETYFRLLKRVTGLISIPFQGEPLSGLQIMGVLETRALDFDNIIILSTNEGVYPNSKYANSFIPYNLRRAFNLPLIDFQDSVSSYHFYRLIHRAKRVWMVYDTRTTGMKTGEVSRFVHQLNYHYQVPIQKEVVVYDILSSPAPVIRIDKDEEVRKHLQKFLLGGERALSASAINTYLNCPLQFYYAVLKDIREQDDVSESVEGGMFGTIIHKVMEELYRPFTGKLVTADLLRLMQKNDALLTEKIEGAFAKEFFKSDKRRKLTGQHLLISETIRKYVKKILDIDAGVTPFTYVKSEEKVYGDIALTNGSVIQLKGFVDRLDEVHEHLRIVDYKSGLGKSDFTTIESLFDKGLKDRRKEVMQVFMYSWMYMSKTNDQRSIQPTIYYLRSMFKDFSPVITHRESPGTKTEILDFALLKDEFEEQMRYCLDEIFDETTPFIQTEDTQHCKYCLFAEVCGRGIVG